MARIPLPVGAWGNISVSGTRGNYRASARFRQANGKTVPRFRTGATKEAARNALLEHLTELREQTIAGEVSGTVTLGSFAGDWFTRWRESANPPASTVRTYRAAVKWIKEELVMLRLTECTTGRLERGVVRISDAHGQTTAKQARSVLRRIFADAVRLDALTANPALGISTVKEQPQQVRAMTAAEVQQLRTAARTWEATPVTANKPMRREIADSIDVMLGTGVRIGELLAIRWDDVDLEATPPTISVMGTVTPSWALSLWVRMVVGCSTSRRRSRRPRNGSCTCRLSQPKHCADSLKTGSSGQGRRQCSRQRPGRGGIRQTIVLTSGKCGRSLSSTG